MDSNIDISYPILEHIHNYNICVEKREIYLHGFLGSEEHDPGVDYRMASMFLKNINLLSSLSDEPIFIYMNSIGGNWNSGMVIYDAIKMCNANLETNIVVYGQAESMSSIIMQAAKNRYITKNSYFMCHYGSFSISSNLLDAQNAIRQERKFTETMINIYAEKAFNSKAFEGKSITHVKNFIKRKMKDGDWYLDPQECIDHGFADYII
jgi:ATP-dependent protease ClpP protease subunit